MRILAILGLASALVLPSVAAAQSWYLVMQTPRESVTFADRDSIRWRDGRPTIEYIRIHARPMRIADQWMHGLGTKTEFDCDSQRARAVHTAGYTITGDMALQTDLDNEWESFPINSGMGAAFRLACSNDTDDLPGINTSRAVLFQATIQSLIEDD